MRRLPLISGLILVTFSTTLAQTKDHFSQHSLLKFGFLGPNIIYEAKITQDMSLKSGVGVALNFGYGGDQIGTVFDYGVFAEVSPRYYYNFRNRAEDNKPIKNYSGNFISIVSEAYLYSVFSSVEDPNQYIFGPTWGLQRNLGKGWYYNFEIGPAVSVSKENTQFDLILGLNIGFQL